MDITFASKKFLIGKLSSPSLLTVGYTIYNSDGAVIESRTTQGVVDLGNGDYGALVNFPAEVFKVGFNGYLQWDDGISGPVFNDAINIVSDLKEFILMLFDKNIELEFIPASVADPSRNVKVGMYDGVLVKHKFDRALNFNQPAFSDFIRFFYRRSEFDSDVVKKTAVNSIDGYGAYGYDPGEAY